MNPLVIVGVCGMIASYTMTRFLSPFVDHNSDGWKLAVVILSLSVIIMGGIFAIVVTILGLTGCVSLAEC